MAVTPALGDIVKLISGGPDMTVEAFDGANNKVETVWFNPEHALARSAFVSETLTSVGTGASTPAPKSTSSASAPKS